MARETFIFWFSGTGNSLYAAKRLAEKIGGARLIKITNEAPDVTVGADAAVGFVFPSYYGNVPRAVRAFVEKINISAGAYIFAVVTMGGVGQGSVGAIAKLFAAKSLSLCYGVGLPMPANYVIMYDPADPEKSAKKKLKADERINEIAADISAGKKLIKKLPITADSLYKNVETLDAGFAASEACTGCGLCESVCPVKNIKMESGRPTWFRRCERCVACISWCPAKAINYGKKTKARRRYRNPGVSADEFRNV